MKSSGVIWLHVSVLACGAFAQDGATPPLDAIFEPKYVEKIWTTQDGLPQDTVTAITQTRDGYLWVGTFGGLARFDGVRFQVFTVDVNPGMKTNRILSLHESRDGSLWIGTDGFGVVRLRDGVFTWFMRNVPQGPIWDITEDGAGTLWFAGAGLGRFRNGHFDLLKPIPDLNRLNVYDVHVDRKDRLWLGTQQGLLLRVGERFEPIVLGAKRGPVRGVVSDHDGRLWLITQGAVGVLVDGEYQEVAKVQTRFLSAGLVDETDEFWFSDQTGQIMTVRSGTTDAHTSIVRRLYQTGERAGVRSSFRDDEGNIWLGTNGKGLIRATTEPFARVGRIAGLRSSAYAVVGDGGDGVWVHGSGSVIVHWNGARFQRLDRSASGIQGSIQLVGGNRNGAWIVDEKGLVCVNENGAERMDPLRASNGMLAAEDGTLWFQHGSRLAARRGGEFKFFQIPDTQTGEQEDEHAHNEPRSPHLLGLTRDGSTWFRDRGRLGRWLPSDDGGRFEFFTVADGIPPGQIRSLHEDASGSIWLSSYGGGLCRLRNGTFKRFGVAEGLPELSLGGILEDDEQRLWVNSNRGVLVLPIADLNAVADGSMERISCRVLSTGEGNGGSAYRTPDGRMWFPTVDDLIVVDPGAYRPNLLPPVVRIEGVVADGVSASLARLVDIAPGERNLEFTYTGLSYRSPEQVRFRYRLENYQAEWLEAGTRRTAFYTKVPPGDYVFHVVAANEDGVWSEQGASLALVLRPHFFETVWFMGLCGTAGLGLIWTLHRRRISRIKRHASALEREIVDRERAEQARRRMEEELRESKKLEAVGRLAGGIAHDFNNILATVLMNSEHLQETLREAEDVSGKNEWIERVESIVGSGHRAATLTKQLLAYSRQQVLSPSVLNPNDVIAALSPMLRQLLPTNIRLSISAAPDIACVRVDESQLEQVVMNLVLNARDAIPGGGRIVLETSSALFGSEHTESHPDMTDGEYVLIAVSDSGVGIDEHVLPHVFEPFFTTKEGGKGTGLGLASVHGIVHQSGGHILVDTTPSVGTTFKVYLPASEHEQADTSPPPPAPPPRALKGAATILICEDNDALRKMVRMTLEHHGYVVLEASLPSEAIDAARRTKSIDLLITDVIMPQKNGRETAEAIRTYHPELPVLYTSGYTNDEILRQGVVDQCIHFLEKPFTPKVLLDKIRSLLDAFAESSL